MISSFGIWTFNINDCFINSGRFSCGGLRCDSYLLYSSAGLNPSSTAQANASQPVSSRGSCNPCCLVGCAGGVSLSQAPNHPYLLLVIRERTKEKSRKQNPSKQKTQAKPGMLPLALGFPTSFQAVFRKCCFQVATSNINILALMYLGF